jgi:hypothetical protein
MKTIAVKEDEDSSPAAFKAVVFYDDISQAARAAASLERAAAGADPALKCDLKLWRLEALGQPAQAAVCMAVAANANLMVLALHGEPPSLEELLDWLEDWAANRRIEDAAVTVLGPEADTTVVLRNALERFAWRRGLAFLGTNEAWEDGAWEGGFRATPRPSPPTEQVPHPTAEPAPVSNHWGIND